MMTAVVPAYNEEENIPTLVKRLEAALRGCSYEILFIDDGSSDRTLEVIKKLRRDNPRIRFISLSRNFGHQNALKAGLDHAAGKCVVTMDADLQHPPELIPQMLARWREGFEVVFTIRKDNDSVSPAKRITARLFYGLVNLVSEVHIQESAADFRLLDRRVVEALKGMEETPFYRGIIPWMGFRQTAVHFEPGRRYAGKSKYSLARMISFALGGLVSFSVMPLRIASLLGFVMAVTGFIVGIKAVFEYLFTHNVVPGWTSTIGSIVFVGGVQLIILGIIGEYLGKLFIATKRRPLYIVRERSEGGPGDEDHRDR